MRWRIKDEVALFSSLEYIQKSRERETRLGAFVSSAEATHTPTSSIRYTRIRRSWEPAAVKWPTSALAQRQKPSQANQPTNNNTEESENSGGWKKERRRKMIIQKINKLSAKSLEMYVCLVYIKAITHTLYYSAKRKRSKCQLSYKL